ncbi:MAG: helix-turn-helix transcriptional regulator [Ferruginibacter sp.]
MATETVKSFYASMLGTNCCKEVTKFLDDKGSSDIGHFNVFDITELYHCSQGTKPKMPYSRKTYYKISLIKGNNLVEYADKSVVINGYAILFATPKIPYHYEPLNGNQAGHFCIFTPDFLPANKTGMLIDELPIFSNKSDFVFEITEAQYAEVSQLYSKMHAEFASDYAYKYDLLRTYVMELIHFGQKLKPIPSATPSINASSRLSTLFIELLERQFPVESNTQTLTLRSAKDYADTLRVHVNHLNKVLKDTTGKTTSEIISGRIAQEAKILLKHTNWNVSEIAYSLGFEEVAHFSNFFKKQANSSPLQFRN